MKTSFVNQIKGIRKAMDIAEQLDNKQLYNELNDAAGTVSIVGMLSPRSWQDVLDGYQKDNRSFIKELLLKWLEENFEVPLKKVYNGKRKKAT